MQTVSDKIRIKRNFTNYVIEENEIMEFLLGDYFSGQLLDFNIQIVNLSNPMVTETPVKKEMIYLSHPYEITYSNFTSDTSYSSTAEPFPRSSLFLKEKNQLGINLYTFDRSYKFMKFDASHYTENNITKSYEVQLNTTILNGTCSDINQIKSYQPIMSALIFFCKNQMKQDDGSVAEYYTVVQVDEEGIDFTKTPVVRYYSFFSDGSITPNLDLGLKYLGTHRKIEEKDFNVTAFFACSVHNSITQASILGVNLTKFIEMNQSNVTSDFGPPNIQVVYSIFFREDLSYYLKILDFYLMYQDDNFTLITFALENIGILMCHFPRIGKELTNSSLSCDLGASQLVLEKTVLSLYKSEDNAEYFYATLFNPPGVVEFDINDPFNAFIYKIFKADDYNNKYYGTSTISVNKNYIIHLMKNMISEEYAIRYYCRNQTYLSIAKYDFRLSKESRTNFFVFPNYYINMIIFKDERMINITYLNDHRLILNATNSSLVKKYQKDKFSVRLTAMNRQATVRQYFNVTFVDSDYTGIEIYNTHDIRDFDIFYNCGDNKFEYVVCDYFNGPNFNLTITNNDTDCDNGSCYFNFINAQFTNLVDFQFNQSQCVINYILPFQDFDNENDDSYNMILVCINEDYNKIRSYNINILSNNLTLTNEIYLPDSLFLHFGVDAYARFLFSINLNLQEALPEKDKYEVHFYEVDDRIYWKTFKTDIWLLNNNQKSVFSYNAILAIGLIIQQIQNDTYNFLFFHIHNRTNFHDSKGFPHQLESEPVKVQFSDIGIFFIMFKDGSIQTFQKQTISIVKVCEQRFGEGLHDFDIFDNKYFVVYLNNQDIKIYDIHMEIYLVYKMKLPFYTQYKDYNFGIFKNSVNAFTSIKRSFYSNLFAILMTKKDDQGNTSHLLFFFDFEVNQHNTFIFTQNVTSIFLNTTYQRIALFGTGNTNTIGLLSNNKLQVYDVKFINTLSLADNERGLMLLHDRCKRIQMSVNEHGLQLDKAEEIAKIQIQAISLFESTEQKSNQTITLHVYSQNQGMAITKKEEKSNFTYTSEKYTHLDSKLLLEDYVEGQGLFFSTECNYHTADGLLQDCDDDKSIIRQYDTQIYTFPIEYVTSTRKILTSFTFGQLFFMFDSQNQLIIQRIPNNSTDLSYETNNPLFTIATIKQEDVFGCNISGFVDQQRLDQISNENELQYLIFYQCRVHNKVFLKIAQVQIFQDINSKEDQNTVFSINVINSTLTITYDIFDIQLININATLEHSAQDQLNATMIITCQIDSSFSNLLYIYDFSFFYNKYPMTFTAALKQEISSVSVLKDTFKATQIVEIPGTYFFLVVAEDYGAYIFDSYTFEILADYPLSKDDKYFDQYLKQIGSFKVFAATGNWPYQIQFMTNFGIYVYYYSKNLTNTKEIFPEYETALRPVTKRIIRQTFDEYEYEIAQNKYGYVYLVTKYIDRSNYDIYLGAVSFFSAAGSKIFSMLKIQTNTQCHSLNENPYYENDPEDQIAVTFICNTLIFIVRICMRPNIIINLESFTERATKQIQLFDNIQYEPGVLQFNDFNITITALNAFSVGSINVEQASIAIQFQMVPQRRAYIFFVVILFLIILTFLGLFFMHQTLSPKCEELREMKQLMRQESNNGNKSQSVKRSMAKQNLKIQNNSSQISLASVDDLSTKFRKLKHNTFGVKLNLQKFQGTFISDFNDDQLQTEQLQTLESAQFRSEVETEYDYSKKAFLKGDFYDKGKSEFK